MHFPWLSTLPLGHLVQLVIESLQYKQLVLHAVQMPDYSIVVPTGQEVIQEFSNNLRP